MPKRSARRSAARSSAPAPRAARSRSRSRGDAAITKVIQMPRSLRVGDLEAQVEMQADQYIPFPMDEVSYDFEVLGPNEKDPDSNDVLLVATRTENVEQRQAAVKAAGPHRQDRRRRGVRARERLQAHDAPDARRRHRSHHRGGRLRREQHHLQRAAQPQSGVHARLRLRRATAHRGNHAHLRPRHGGGRTRQEGRRPAGQLPVRSARSLHRRHDAAGEPLAAVLPGLRAPGASSPRRSWCAAAAPTSPESRR